MSVAVEETSTKMPVEKKLIEKLGDIPVVSDGWCAAWDVYNKVKEYNSLTRITLQVAETSVKKAGEISAPLVGPIVNKYQPQIDNINKFACEKLDTLEEKYPIIQQPSSEVQEACVNYVKPVVGYVKPVVSQVQVIYGNGKKQVNNVKTRGTNFVNGAKDLSIDTASKAVNATFNTPPGRLVTSTLDGALNMADNIVDKYLPEEKEDSEKEDVEEDEDVPIDDGENANEGTEQMEVMEPSPQRVLVHFRSVSDKVRQRMYNRAMKDFRTAKKHSLDTLKRMQDTVNLIEYAKTNLDGAKNKVEHIWSEIKNENPSEKEENMNSETTSKIEERIIHLGKTLALQIRSTSSAMESAASEMGQFVRHPISKSKEYTELLNSFSSVKTIQEYSLQSVAKARDNLKFMRKRLQELIDSWEGPAKVSVDVNMDMDLQEADVTMDEADVPQEKPVQS